MTPFDILVLTAANEAQAQGYRVQLQWRRDNGLLDLRTETLVITDPGNRRVGSLGATLNVLAALADRYHKGKSQENPQECFDKRRILICHSGGDSRRTPAYAAQGKVFTPLPCVNRDGQPLALFDLILTTATALPAPAGGHVLITSGDVLLTFDHASVDFSRHGVTGVAYYGSVERGARHGVYVPYGFGANPQRTECVPVANFLQKPTAAMARAANAIDHLGHVAIDTGIVSLDPATCATLLMATNWQAEAAKGRQKGMLAQIVDGTCPSLDIYEELTMALAPHFEKAQYLNRFVTQRGHDRAHGKRMAAFHDALQGTPFQVNIVPYCDFFHIGSSRELLEGFTGISRTAQTYDFVNGSGSSIVGRADNGHAFVFNSSIATPIASKRALVESTNVTEQAGLDLAGDNIVTGLPSVFTGTLHLPFGVGVVCLPIGEHEWSVVVYGLDDDFKTPFVMDESARANTRPCLFLNKPIEETLTALGLQTDQVWQGDHKDGLWSARLWRVGRLTAVMRDAQTLLQTSGARQADGRTFARHPKGGTRYSLAALLLRVNHTRLIGLCAETRRRVNLHKVTERLLNNDALAASAVCDNITNGTEARLVLVQLIELLHTHALCEPLLRARVLSLVALIQKSFNLKSSSEDQWLAVNAGQLPANAQSAAFAAVAESVALSYEPAAAPRVAAILQDQVVWVTTPVRIDFAGGWSDTPPICSERGGTVLNAAVTLNGQYPVQVIAKLNSEGCIRLASIDLGQRKEIRTTSELLDHHDPHDWSSLAKAALVLAGIGPSNANESLAKWLKKMGGGLDLTIFSSLPKGSGMGTSSILGAAVIACLNRVLGLPPNTDRLIRMTSILEQRMCTGGGWQDQVGGIMPGVKLIRTQPGADQTVALRWSTFDLALGGEFKERCLLYFTGQKRMARNILQNVVNGYLRRDPVVLRTVEELKSSAEATKEALDAQDFDGFARGVAHYWELKKRIDPGSTNKLIEMLLESIESEVMAALLPGAGGGGFIFMIAKSAEAAQRIRQKFEVAPPNPHARFFDFAIDRQGLKVTVL